MGLCIGSLGSSIACCFGNAFCSLCCAACPSCKGSTSTRIVYGLILLAGLITSCVMLIPGLEKTLAKIPALCSGSKLTGTLMPSVPSINCSAIVGFLAVYRLSFGMTIFFFLFSMMVSRELCLRLMMMINEFMFEDDQCKIIQRFSSENSEWILGI